MRVSRYVVYPFHGAGQITKRYTPKEMEEEYYQIEFLNSDVTLSVPIKKAERLGLRYPLSIRSMKKLTKSLGKRIRLDQKKIERSDEIADELLRTGLAEDAVDAYNLLDSVKARMIEDEKTFSSKNKNLYEKAKVFIDSEVALVLGEPMLIEDDGY